MRWITPRWRESSKAWEWCPARRIDGKVVWGKSCPTQEAAFEAAKAMESRRRLVANIGDLTLRQACERAVERMLSDGGSDYTAKGYRARFKRWYEILAADAPVMAITADDVEHLKAKRRSEHGVGSNTIRTDLVVLQRVLDLAGLRGDNNAVRGVSRPKVSEPDRPFFTMENVRRLADRMRASKKPDAEWHAVVVTFLAITGARAYEIERLRASHVEPSDGGGCTVVLHGAKGKQAAARRVFIDKKLAPVASAFVAEAKDAPPLAPTTIATICKRWARELNEPRLSGRVLRRTYATEMARHVPLQYVQRFLGHTQLTTTQKYLGVDPQLAQDAAAQLRSSLVGTGKRQGRARGRKSGGGSATRGTPATRPGARHDADSPSSESHGRNG